MYIKSHLFPYILATLMLVGLCNPIVAQTRHSSDKCCGTTSEPVVRPLGEQLRNVSATELRSIVNEPVLRTYRLAIVVDYSYLMRHFSGDVGRAEAFCRRVGQELDRIYRRDIGIGFQLVLRPELIRRSSAEAVFGYSAGGQSSIDAPAIVGRSTAELNKLIGADSYDIGLWLVNFWGYNGKASMSGGFAETHKAAATISNDNIGTIAHELAHLFGAWHTASQNVDYSIHTEPEDGTSIMSYGFHATEPSKLFFSLPSIQQIRANLSRCGYYRNGDKQQLVPSRKGYEDYTNLSSAVEVVGMRPEAFALGSVAKSYTIPRGTSVRLAFASYSDAKDYLYNAHQNDRSSTTWTSRAKLEADYWQESPVVFLGLPQYNTYLDYTPEAADAKIGLPVGEYKVLAGAVERASAGAGDHKQSLDAVETQLRVVEGKPLRLTTNSDTRYLRAGGQLSLRWEADPKIFAGYNKVRIWLSDDYGKSYKFLLVDGTDNDGEHTITVPDISVGSVRALGNQEQGKAVFLLEIVGHVACATTAHYPLRHTTGGGFIIQSATNTLQPYVYPYIERGGGTTPTPPSPQYHRVTLQQSEGGTLSIEHSDLTKVVAGTKLKVSVTLNEGYELIELKAGEQDILASREFVVQGNTEVRATYRRKAPTTYRVDLKQSEGGTLSIEHSDLTKVVVGTKLKVSVTLKEGYDLIELKAGEQDILASREFVVQGNTEVRATYRRKAPTTYRVSLIQSDGGTLSIAHENLSAVVSGTKLKVSVTLNEGYELSELKAGQQDILASREFVVRGNTEVRATYRRKAPTTYRVDLKQSEGGTLSIEHSDLTKVVAGTTLKVSVALKEGYELSELKAGEQDILASREFVVQGNTEVRATYRRKAPTTYRVSLIQSEGGTLSIEHSDLTKVVAGTKLKVSVALKEGYELVELKAGEQDILASREFVVQGNTEVRAIYRRVVIPVAPPVVPHEDDKPRLDAEVKVYPTVFTTELHISGYESLSLIELYSLSGHRLRRYAPQATLSVEGLPAGIYLVLLHSSKAGVRPQRFTVQKR